MWKIHECDYCGTDSALLDGWPEECDKCGTTADRFRRFLKAKLKDKLAATVDPPPRYDAVYFDGVAWLDSL